MKTVLVFICTLVALSLIDGFLLKDYPVRVQVSTPVGDIIGLEYMAPLNSSNGYKIRKFLGIPYAESPTGNLRFRKPVPKANFTTAFDATQDGPACYQLETPFGSKYARSEDCLRLNIYVPVTTDTASTASKPVMLWIHGGKFVNGESNGFDASILSGFGNVIVVIINYRLAYFGFYTTGDSNASGNFGLWDQHLAIKWTVDNIKAFGGNPGEMTVFGESAGASAVIYQTFYPGNKGLFHHAIAESGTRTNPWTHGKTDVYVKSSRRFANAAGCQGTTPSEYSDCLRLLPGDVLNRTMNTMREGAAVGPIVDNEFVLDMPYILLKGGRNVTAALDMFHSVDLMIGMNNADGVLDLFEWMTFTNTTNPFFFNMPRNIYEHAVVPHYIQTVFKVNATDAVRNLTIHEYTDWSNPADGRKRVAEMIRLATDFYVGIDTAHIAIGHTNNNVARTSTYSFEFAIQPLTSIFPVPPIVAGPEVCKHADEIGYVFGRGIENVSENSSLRYQYSTYLATMTAWSNFAKTGNPNVPNDLTPYTVTPWPEFGYDSNYLRISPSMSNESAKTAFRYRAVDFWANVLPSIINKDKM